MLFFYRPLFSRCSLLSGPVSTDCYLGHAMSEAFCLFMLKKSPHGVRGNADVEQAILLVETFVKMGHLERVD
jgi:hypothetical protein